MAAKKSKGTRKSTVTKKRTKKSATKTDHVMSLIKLWGGRVAVGAFCLVLLSWLFAWFVLSNAHMSSLNFVRTAILDKTAQAGFVVKNILVEGQEYSDAQALLALINIGEGDPLLAFDPHGAKEQIERIGWVQSALVSRRFPDTIFIRLDEREPFALWHNEGKLALIDAQGEVLERDNLERFKDLIMVRGAGAEEQISSFLPILQAEEKLISYVDHARLVDGRRWDLKLRNGATVKLPEEGVGLALAYLVRRQDQDSILDSEEIQDIDARYSGRLIIRTKLGKVQDYKMRNEDDSSNL